MFWMFWPTSIIILFFGFSRKIFKKGLRLFLLMLVTAFGFNGFPNTNLGFLGLTILSFDLFCKILDEPVRPVVEPVRPVAMQPASVPLFCCPPSVEVLDVVSVLLPGDFGSTILA